MKHTCHWPGCTKEVPPAMWGCSPHWFSLPKHLRERIWATYRRWAGDHQDAEPRVPRSSACRPAVDRRLPSIAARARPSTDAPQGRKSRAAGRERGCVVKDFGRWFQEQSLPVAAPEPVTYAELDALGFDVDDDHTGRILAVYCICRACERRIKLTDYLSLEEIASGEDAYHQYCGGSPGCTP